ncbi:flavin-containing monooxygenase [Moritella yayanosii]|uniref:Putative Flavin-containing monooxygenase n=1 Tax=Moritella yayanosii TaxID=69539 RepID=A0A330LMZ4_9GAMM|nr:NAD(P)-binding domain-containing protein [Moritella yayanosii]SQD78009.1 putative Flavin-containing monooxygenase [Moritella yayanosii]
MQKQQQKICVIGAGSSGLVAIKELIDEGHQVTCFETLDKPGGNFYCCDDIEKSGSYDSTMLTISNYMMAYSSYPPKLTEQRKFWSAREYQEYLLDFTKHFGLDQHIQYERAVNNVKKLDDGTYHVDVRSTNDESQVLSFIFDAIAVCTGSSRVPKYIDIKGLDGFKGDVYHSAFYKNAKPYTGRSALCIGMGETGVDVASEIADVAGKCMLSLRQRQPSVERFPLARKHPSDAYTSHFLYAMPVSAGNARMKLQFKAMKKFGKAEKTRAFADWNLKAGNYFNYFNLKSDLFIDRIVENKMAVNTSGIDYLGEDHVVFNDGHKEDIDMIMLNTGYMDKFDFLENIELPDMRQLYKHMIHPDLGRDIVFIGWARPAVGGVPACSEMQSRYFALLCSGKKELPEMHKLKQLIAQQAFYEDEVYFKNRNVRSLVHYTGYMHDFSKVIGCSPWRLSTFLNPVLTYRLWVGSQMPSFYRLYGPHSNYDEAKKSIFNVPIAFNFIEAAILTTYTLLTRGLATLGIMKSDPKY